VELHIRAYRDTPPHAFLTKTLEHLFAQRTPVGLRDALLSVAVTDPATANTAIVRWLSDEQRAGLQSDSPKVSMETAAVFIRASFAWGLAWTTEPPAAWWWRRLEQLICTRPGDHALIPLPSTFLPPEIVAGLPRRGEIGVERTIPYLYSASVTPHFVRQLCDYRGPSEDVVGHELARYLAAHRDPVECTGEPLTMLLGHPHPALAAQGLASIAQQRPPGIHG
jgi:hypothetical protein